MCQQALYQHTNRAVSPDLKKITSALLEAQTKTKLLYCCICEGWGQWSPYLWLPILWFQLRVANESEHGRIYMYTVCYLEKERDPTSTTLQFVCSGLDLCSAGEGAQGLVYG